MPVALVQQASAASSSVTLGANATAGNTVVVAVACLGSTSATGVTGITLGGGPDNFALVTPGPSAQDATSPNDFINVSVWADANCAAAAGVTVTGTGVVAVWAFEFSGLSGLTDLAQVFPVTGYHDSWVTSLPQTKVPAEAWLAITCAANQTATETLTVNNVTGWTLETAYNGTSGTYFWGAASGYQTVNTVGTPAWSGAFSQASFSVTVLVTLGAGTPPAATAANAPLSGNIAVTGGLAVQGAVNASGVITQGGAPVGLTPTNIITGNYTAKPGDFVIVQTPANRTMRITFPSGVATGSMIGVKLINPTGLGLIVQTSGADVFDALPAGITELNLTTAGTTFIAQYKASAATWYIQTASYAEPATLALFPNIGALPAAPAANSLLPGDLGFATWSYDPAYLTSPLAGTALSSGVIYLAMCPVRATVPLGNTFAAWITSGGGGLTAGQNFVGVYSAGGTLLCRSGDVTAAFGAAGAFAPGFVSAGTASPPFVWAAFLSNGTTPPSFARTVNQAGILANGNTGLSGPRFGTVSGTFTSLPSSFSTGSLSAAPTAYFAGLS